MAPHSSTLCLENPMDGGAWWTTVHGVAKSRTRLSDFTFTFHFHALEKEMASHSSVLAWRIPGTGEPGGLPSMGSHRVRHDWSDLEVVADVDQASQVALVVKNLTANAGDIRDTGSIPGLERSPGEGNGYLLQYSCLENPMDRGAWWATVHRVAKSWTWLSDLAAAAAADVEHLIKFTFKVDLKFTWRYSGVVPLCGKLFDSRNLRHCFSLFKATWRQTPCTPHLPPPAASSIRPIMVLCKDRHSVT